MDWRKCVKKDPKYYRPVRWIFLMSDPSKAKRVLEREAQTRFRDLIRLMVDAAVAAVMESVIERSRVSAVER
jgi:GDPmannose 4,6-dehydratase